MIKRIIKNVLIACLVEVLVTMICMVAVLTIVIATATVIASCPVITVLLLMKVKKFSKHKLISDFEREINKLKERYGGKS